jgi:hypothetical protein
MAKKLEPQKDLLSEKLSCPNLNATGYFVSI